MTSRFQRYLMPALVFESVVIGGGYATGRELVEFFLKLGPRQGLLARIVTLAVWSSVLAVSFELARQTRSFDYRSSAHRFSVAFGLSTTFCITHSWSW